MYSPVAWIFGGGIECSTQPTRSVDRAHSSWRQLQHPASTVYCLSWLTHFLGHGEHNDHKGEKGGIDFEVSVLKNIYCIEFLLQREMIALVEGLSDLQYKSSTTEELFSPSMHDSISKDPVAFFFVVVELNGRTTRAAIGGQVPDGHVNDEQ